MKKQTKLALQIATIGFLALSMGMVLFPIQRTPRVEQVDFVRNIEQLNTSQSHGAASQWDYLFEDETTTQTTQSGQLGTQTTIPDTTPTQTTTSSSFLNAMQESFNQAIAGNTNGTYQGTFGTTTSGSVTATGGNVTTGKITTECTTPRGQVVANKDFVLAYQQRKDVSSMCNIERRICNNGVLEGSYNQKSCIEDITYEYQRAQVISYNQPIVNPLVQPGEPSNAGGDFGTNGQVNQVKTPTSMRGTTNTAGTTTSTSVTQTTVNKNNCIAPRGTTVKHGQFVKAYKSSIGLLDVPCETELRLCVNGTLKGKFVNKSCTFKNITYNDYIAGNTDFTKPTPQDIQGTLINQDNSKNYGVWDRIKGVFK